MGSSTCVTDPDTGRPGTLDAAGRGEGAVITRHGRPAAVILGYEEWERLSNVPSFGRLLMAAPIEDGDLPERSALGLREEFG